MICLRTTGSAIQLKINNNSNIDGARPKENTRTKGMQDTIMIPKDGGSLKPSVRRTHKGVDAPRVLYSEQ